jgi:hypothetical protein
VPPSANRPNDTHDPASPPSLKYPVLKPVMPLLETHLRPQLVCHLLELYFTGTSANHLHMAYRNSLCHILRKSSFLADSFRSTSPALLTSMLWVASIDDRAFVLPISSLQQGKICRFLGDLTKALLRVSDDASPHHQGSSLGSHYSMEPDAHLDRVITYIHIASILSVEQNPENTGWYVQLSSTQKAFFLIVSQVEGGI